MTQFTQVSENGDLIIPKSMLQQLGAQRFGMSIENGKLVLSPIQHRHSFGPAWRKLTPEERAADLEKWVNQLEPGEQTNISDEDLRRENMYEDRL